jgi:hypothetical protein
LEHLELWRSVVLEGANPLGEIIKGKTMTDTPFVRVDADGSKIWSVDELPHREDGPAIEQVDGSNYWFVEGLYHREDGPALDEIDGTQHWYLKGKHHREDGPAIRRPDGSKEWWLDHKRHREDGPAVITPTGEPQYWLLDIKVDENTVMNDVFRAAWLNKNTK